MAFSFKDIIAWQKSYEFVLLVYKATKSSLILRSMDYLHSFSVQQSLLLLT